ncbi:MAG: ppiB 2 [Gemmatimonadetes bacterium]|nr:ppiB 2 [Gemmatimonadota bacterium]
MTHWRLYSSLALAAAFCACRTGGYRQSGPRLEASARLLRIEDTRRDEPAFLDSLLTSSDAGTRARAVLAVGRIGARSHLPAVRMLASDPDTAVSANALFSLGLLKDTASVSLAAASLRAGAPQGVEAAWLLGQLGDVGRKPLIDALGDTSLSAPVRAALILAAARLRPLPTASLVPLLADPDSAIAWRAAYAIARGRGTAAMPQLLELTRSPWAAVREQVARGASRTASGEALAAAARASLEMLVRDTSTHVRTNAVRTLSTYGPPTQAAVLAALLDDDAGVRLTAAQSLGGVLDSARTIWLRVFERDTSFTIRRAIAEGAIKYGHDLATSAGWASSTDWHRRAAAAELDGHGPAIDAAPRLSRWASDPDGRVRAAAAGAEAQLAESASVRGVVRARLRQALSDSDAFVRTAALGALAKGITESELAAALVGYGMSLSDPDNDARLAFWTLVDSAVTRKDFVLSESVTQSLSSLARPSDPLERIAAARIGRFAGWRDSAGTARPLSWYEARAREAAGRPPVLAIETQRGTLELQLFADEAPLTVFKIVSLARRGFFDGQQFHRVVPNFVAQMGDPRGDGNSGPGYAIRDEMNRRRYLRGTLGMALSGPNTGGSQFFVTHSPQPHLDGDYTVFGQLIRGGDVLDRIVQGDRIVRVTVH